MTLTTAAGENGPRLSGAARGLTLVTSSRFALRLIPISSLVGTPLVPGGTLSGGRTQQHRSAGHFITKRETRARARGHLDRAAWRFDVCYKPNDARTASGTDAGTRVTAGERRRNDDASPQAGLTLPTDRPRARDSGRSRQRRRSWKPTEPPLSACER